VSKPPRTTPTIATVRRPFPRRASGEIRQASSNPPLSPPSPLLGLGRRDVSGAPALEVQRQPELPHHRCRNPSSHIRWDGLDLRAKFLLWSRTLPDRLHEPVAVGSAHDASNLVLEWVRRVRTPRRRAQLQRLRTTAPRQFPPPAHPSTMLLRVTHGCRCGTGLRSERRRRSC
jgi:hypothetical protein